MFNLVPKPPTAYEPSIFVKFINKIFGIPTLNTINNEPELSKDKAIQLTIFHATGGRVVETKKYDPINGHTISRLYIVTSEQDFGQEIDKILTVECLRSGS